MEQQPNPSENQGFSQIDLNAAINQRNEQAMQEQAALATYAEENRKMSEEARQAIAASETDVISADDVPKTAATEEQPKPVDRIIDSGDIPR